MNEKTKGILEKAWNEPRRFFFWLGMLSACGVAAVLSLYSTALAAPTLVLSFIALGCAVCLLANIAAFVLAWIPPLRPHFAPLLRRRFFVLGCLVTLVALFYAVENWRGRRAWQNYKRQWEAKGERFELAAFIPPPVPDDQNFFETPLWAGLHFVRTNHTTVWSDPNWDNQVMFDVYGPRGQKAPSIVNLYQGQRTDLAAWQAFYRGTNNWFPASGGRLTNYFPVAKEPQTPAADVLLALSRFDANRRLLLEASARPRARFWINYDAVTAALLPHLSRMKASAIYLSLHSVAALRAGDRQTALADIKLSFRLLESIRDEPVLISYLVRMAMLPWTLQPIWEGLAGRQWTEPELNLIQAELGKLDFLADCQVALRSERAGGLWVVDYVRTASPSALEATGLDDRAGLGPGLETALFQLAPSGWFDQNKLSICRLYENYFLPQVDREDSVIRPGAVRRSDSALAAQWRRSTPYDWLDRLLLPALGRVVRRCAYAQSFADLAGLACALERCRLANGQIPETLETLVPRFLAKLPHDLINGQPLKYHRTDDGQFVLYSVGWNETDDGGKVALTKKGIPDRDHGDWVWRYPSN